MSDRGGMQYPERAIDDSDVPLAPDPLLQHALQTYASETNKTASVWRAFRVEDVEYRPHGRSSRVIEIFRHQLLSERRFFGEFLGLEEPPVEALLPVQPTPDAFARRLADLARPRLRRLADQAPGWWLERVPFFDTERERMWIFWRRVLHSAHHRTQLTVYLRLLDRPVVPTYGPTADVTWTGADPTATAEAAARGAQPPGGGPASARPRSEKRS